MSFRNASTNSRAPKKSSRRRLGADGHGIPGIPGGTDAEDDRAARIQQRQHELEEVLDRHDTLVREAFHLEKFGSLVRYDPKVAKEDNSAVFQEYKTRFDLLEQSAEAGPSRRTTRRAHTERVQLLKGPVPGPSTASQGRQLRKAETLKQPDNISVWPALSAVKGKGKQNADIDGLVTTVHSERARRGNGKGKSSDQFAHSMPELRSQESSQTISGRRSLKRRADDIVSSAANGHPRPPLGKKRKVIPSISSSSAVDLYLPAETVDDLEQPDRITDNGKLFMPPSEPLPTVRSKRSFGRERHAQATKQILSSPNLPTAVISSHPPWPVKLALPRIKLIVRRPPPSLSSPRQRPSPPQYGESLTSLLSSYSMWDNKDIELDKLERMAQNDAAIWGRIDALRRHGRLLLPAEDVDFYFSSGSQPKPSGGAGTPNKPTGFGDIWARVIEAVVERYRSSPVIGPQVASQVASKIRGYWDGQAVKEDKVKLQEEKRLRALAKATIKLVVAEWKKAVHHVREEERHQLEAEEKKRGDQHLSALVDQSGSILKAQHLDLSKAVSRSRSSSVSGAFGHPASPEPQPSDSVSKTDEDESAQDESDDSEDDDGIGLSYLVQDAQDAPPIGKSVTSSRSPSPVPTIGQEEADMRSEGAASSQGALGTSRTASPSLSFGHIEDDASANMQVTESNTEDMSERSMSAMLSSYRRSPSPQPFPSVVPPFGMFEDISDIAFPGHHPDSALATMQLPSKSPAPSIVFTIQDESIKEALPVCQDAENPTSPDVESTPTHLDEASRSSTVQPEEGTELYNKNPRFSVQSDVAMETQVDAEDHDEHAAHEDNAAEDMEEDVSIPFYLRPFAVTPVEWDTQSKIKAPFLLRGTLRPYQQAGLEWLASLHTNNLNGILADEMGLGKTIQTIALLAHLACDRGIWGPHLIIVPTSVLLNWEMEFKKFLPGFKILSYHGNTKRRKELRQGWNNKYHFNVCVTSYTLASRDAHVFKRKHWYYMILDEAHMIKNFKSQRWNTLLMFRSFRRLLLTGTPLQNNLTELWALLQFLMAGTHFANLKEFGEWFSNPLERAIEMGNVNEETQQRVSKLHTVLRPYLLRRLKRDVEKELPSKFEHLVMCPLSKRQRFLYDEFMARADTRHDLQSGVYQKIANILMQLRKVVNHPDLFEVRPILTSFAMERSAIADFEIKALFVRRELLKSSDEDRVNLDVLGLQFVDNQNTSLLAAVETRRLDGTPHLPMITELPGEPPPYDTRTSAGYKRYRTYQLRAANIARWSHIGYLNLLRCQRMPIYSQELVRCVKPLHESLPPLAVTVTPYLNTVDRIHSAIKSYASRADEMAGIIDRFAFATPAVVARDLPAIALSGLEGPLLRTLQDMNFDVVLHRAAVKLQIAFPDPSLLQYDCGKLQELAQLLRERKAGGHRILIFTQMTRILDILETFLNLHGYLYLRLDGATKIEDRQYITERFNSDQRVFCFISSSRSGGVGINLTGADTVIFYDSDFNPQMDRQCEDRAHRIGQIRDVHIYRFVSRHTVEEALLRKANQKRSLDDLVIQKGEFDWRSLFSDEVALTKALGDVEDTEDAHAAAVAAREAFALEGADEADFEDGGTANRAIETAETEAETAETQQADDTVVLEDDEDAQAVEEEVEEEGGTVVEYMVAFVRADMEYFRDL
ncbi:hypothetical protein SCP_0305740 [Sparassis crispa]|uniref:DNA helicase n=1 Tax=Sparassis crispa TaxID=139825 RepID=A0A401GF77_9APHY|nr:hypothetical protein SCP_0305740 [Sparassis crispa]GBE80854.1 hypothetical protein SCP_0305740 [Sparassis crispa]